MHYHHVPFLSIKTVVDVFFEEFGRQQTNVVVIGANSGEIEDFVSECVKREDVFGVMVEPVPGLFKKLKEKYGTRKNLHYENSAIDKRNGKKKLYYLENTSADLPSWCTGLGTFNKKTILNHSNQIPDIEKYLACMEVRCITFDFLLKKYNVPQVHLLQIDTEGYDYEILRSIDFSKHSPQVIIVEYLHLSFYQYFSAIEFLINNKYSVHRSDCSYDLVAVHHTLLE
jgi:FkbM family methyltransferase